MSRSRRAGPLPWADIRIETMRGSGPGGQHRNKTDSAVRLMHRPTGVMARCESERSQHRNRAAAYAILCARVAAAESREAPAPKRNGSGWTGHIRVYALDRGWVKDLRTGVERRDLKRVLGGDLSRLAPSGSG